MMPAAKHGDMQIGVDIHLCTVPPGVPAPLPTPHMSVVFDPFDYVPILGATVTVCGMKRATAGTSGKVVHIPPGFPFAPKMPDSEDELFMGSATVLADGDPFSHIGHPVLACQVAGMMSPFRKKKKGGPRAMVLPTVFNLAIPTTVFIGGPPTISLMGMAMKGAFSALGKLAKSKVFKRLRQKVFKNMKPGFLKCVVLRAEPVNILDGSVSVEQEDFTLPGRLPIEWRRSYSSSDTHVGLCGRGWQTMADIRLEVDPADGSVLMQGPEVGPLSFGRLPAAQGEAAFELELSDGARLTDHGSEWRVQTKDDRIYGFPRSLASRKANGHGVAPIGSISDRCGNTLTFEYRHGRPAAIAESNGRRLVLTIERERLMAVALIDAQTSFEHGFVRYEYNAAGDLVAVVDALDAPYRFAYSPHGMVRHTDRNGLSFHYAYDAQGRVVHAWGDGGLYDYKFEYLDALKERRITDSLGHVSTVKLNDAGLPINEIDPLGGQTIYEYDDVGRPSAVVDPDGHRTEYVHDERGNLLSITRPDGSQVVTVYSEGNKAISVATPDGAIWEQGWDERGLMVTQVTPLGHASRYEYGEDGMLSAMVSPLGARVDFSHDSNGLLNQVSDGQGHTTTFQRDGLGRIRCRIDGLQQRTAYEYDTKGRLTHFVLPSGASVQCSYDCEGNLVRYTDGAGAVTQLSYAGLGQVVGRTQADGHQVRYHYDSEERLAAVVNQRGEAYVFRRDALGRVVEEIDYWGQSQRYSYSPGGQLRQSVDPLGRSIAHAHDKMGRVVSKKFSDPRGAEANLIEERFEYDALGRLVMASNPDGQFHRQFDLEGRLTTEVQQQTAGMRFSVNNRYDEVGNRVERRTESHDGRQAGPGHCVKWRYGPDGRFASVSIDDEAPRGVHHDEFGHVVRSELAPGLVRDCAYDDQGRLSSQSVTRGRGQLFATHYDYDRAGNLAARRDSAFGTDTYVHDPVGRILEHADPTGMLHRFFTDAAGDRLMTRPVSSGDDSALAWRRDGAFEGASYRFDRAGNLIFKATSSERLEFEWDANQRLVSSCRSDTAVPSRTPTLTVYGYDALGRRIFKRTGGRLTWFGWDGEAIAFDQTMDVTTPGAAGSLSSREFVHQPESFEPAAMLWDRAAGATQVLHFINDPNGCPTRLIDGSGTIRWSAMHSAWGEVVRLGDASIDNPIRLQGQYADPETGLHYNRHRYYDPHPGCFVGVDPLGLRGGLNLHEYAPNALGWIDPLGLQCKPGYHYRPRAGTAPDPGLVNFEHQLRSKGVHVVATNVEIVETATGKVVGEVDVLTKHAAIQYKNGASSAAAVIDQIKNKTEPFLDIPVVGFVEGAGGTAKGAARTIKNAAPHVLATNNLDTLADAIK